MAERRGRSFPFVDLVAGRALLRVDGPSKALSTIRPLLPSSFPLTRPLLIVCSRSDGTNEMFFNSRYAALKHVSLSETNFRRHSQKTTDFAAQEKERRSAPLLTGDFCLRF